MIKLNRATAVASTVALSGLALAGCSGSSSSPTTSSPAATSATSTASPTGSPTSSPTASPSIIGGEAACTKVALGAAVTTTGIKVQSVDTFACAKGWAVVIATVGPSAATAVTSTYVFEAEGQFWIPKDRASVCGTSQATAMVPAAIYQKACQTN